MNWLVSHNTALVFPIDNSVSSKNVGAERADTLFQVPTSLMCEERIDDAGQPSPSEVLNVNLHGVEESAGQALGTGDQVPIDWVMVQNDSRFQAARTLLRGRAPIGLGGFRISAGHGCRARLQRGNSNSDR
jgi:hypothetical protein